MDDYVYNSSTEQVDKMSPEEAQAFLRELLDHSAMRSPEVNQQVRKMLRGQRDQVAWFGRMEPGADAECLPALVDAKPKKPIGAIVKMKKLCIKCNDTPRQTGKKHEGCCGKCSPAVKKLCVKCKETPRQNGSTVVAACTCQKHVTNVSNHNSMCNSDGAMRFSLSCQLWTILNLQKHRFRSPLSKT